MVFNRQLLVFKMVLFMALVGLATSSSVRLSEKIFSLGSESSVASTMEQQESQEMNCPVDFASKNYTIITSQCKAPEYNATLCCSAFKQFACPLAAEINDVKNNNCASIMFKTIHTKGNYQPGMFLSKCRETKQGLSCQKSTFH